MRPQGAGNASAVLRFLRAVVLFVAALVALVGLVVGLGGDLGLGEVLLAILVAAALAWWLSGRGLTPRPRASRD